MNEIVSKFISENSVLVILIGIWLFLLLTAPQKDSIGTYIDNALLLLTKPANIGQYSKGPGSQIASLHNRKEGLRRPVSKAAEDSFSWLTNFAKDKQYLIIGQLFLGVCLILFALADFIVLANVAEAKGIPLENLIPGIQSLLAQFSVAITLGSFMSLIAAGLVFFDSLPDKNSNIPTEKIARPSLTGIRSYGPLKLKIVQVIGFVVLLASLFVMVYLGIIPYDVTSSADVPQWMLDLADVCIDFIIRFNIAFTTLIILEEGIYGFFAAIRIITAIIILVICVSIVVSVEVIYFGAVGIFDLLMRAILWIGYTISFLIWSPLSRVANVPAGLVNFLLGLFGVRTQRTST